MMTDKDQKLRSLVTDTQVMLQRLMPKPDGDKVPSEDDQATGALLGAVICALDLLRRIDDRLSNLESGVKP